MNIPVSANPTEEMLPQIMGDFAPVDVWQRHMNQVFYGVRGHSLRELYQTFASADYRLAYALATDYYRRVYQRDHANAQDRMLSSSGEPKTGPVSTLTIHEWGCGNGNLAACFLDRVKELDQDGLIYPRIQYVLVDAVASVVADAQANPDLAKHSGRYTVLQADVTDLQACQDGSVDRIFCNELWSELPTKLLIRKGGEFMEEHLRPNLKESRLNDIADWSGFIHAFDQADGEVLKGFPSVLDDIVWERTYEKIDGKNALVSKNCD